MSNLKVFTSVSPDIITLHPQPNTVWESLLLASGLSCLFSGNDSLSGITTYTSGHCTKFKSFLYRFPTTLLTSVFKLFVHVYRLLLAYLIA